MFKLIRYHFPTFVKHVLAPQDDFGMQKNLVNKHKNVGFGLTIPPPNGTFPTFSRFFSVAVPNPTSKKSKYFLRPDGKEYGNEPRAGAENISRM